MPPPFAGCADMRITNFAHLTAMLRESMALGAWTSGLPTRVVRLVSLSFAGEQDALSHPISLEQSNLLENSKSNT